MDRRSNMAYGGYKEPAKKDGAGGSYTWGSPLDVTYESSYTATAGVTLAPAVTVSPMVMTQSLGVNVMDPVAFPTLGTAPAPTLTSSWGPATATTAVPAVLTAQALRPGSLDIVGSQHPRNQFAKKPYIRPVSSVGTTTVQQGQIDWNQMPSTVLQQIVQASGPAHLSPYTQAAPTMVPLEQLRPIAAAQQTYQQMTPAYDQRMLNQGPQMRKMPGGRMHNGRMN